MTGRRWYDQPDAIASARAERALAVLVLSQW